MSGALFLSGGTGFLGMSLIARLLEAGDGPDIFLAVRARDQAEADERVAATLARLYESPPEAAARLHAVPADLTSAGLGIARSQRATLAAEVERVVHSAASVSFTLPLDEAREINVDGTRRMLELARELPRLERFVHVSTAYVAGRAAGAFCEADAGGGDFRNTYEQSKAEAELDLAAAAETLPIVVVRPSIVVGESGSGWTAAFNVLYWPLQAFARGLLQEVPADPAGIVDIVPVDYVVKVIERAAFAPAVADRLHAVAGESALRVDALVAAAAAELGRPLRACSRAGRCPTITRLRSSSPTSTSRPASTTAGCARSWEAPRRTRPPTCRSCCASRAQRAGASVRSRAKPRAPRGRTARSGRLERKPVRRRDRKPDRLSGVDRDQIAANAAVTAAQDHRPARLLEAEQRLGGRGEAERARERRAHEHIDVIDREAGCVGQDHTSILRHALVAAKGSTRRTTHSGGRLAGRAKRYSPPSYLNEIASRTR